MNYEVRRQDRLSSSGSTIAETLAVRGRSSNRKSKGDQGRSKSRSGFRDLKSNQCAFYKKLEYWKVDCPKAKGKKMESNTKANLAQADGSDEDSSVFLSLSLLLLLITQIMLSGSWIPEPPIMCARIGPGFLALRS